MFCLFLIIIIILDVPFNVANKLVLGSWFGRQVPKYFNYTEVLEYTDEDVMEYTSARACIFAVCPHGVISYGGICSGLVESEFGAPLRPKVNGAGCSVVVVLKGSGGQSSADKS